MIGAAIGAVASIGSSIFGGIKKRKAMKKQKRILDGQMQENDQWFNAEYGRDVLDNPESRSYLKSISDKLRKQNRAMENNAVATGATHENMLAQKQAANEVMSDAVNNVVAQQTARKDGIRQQYMANKQSILNNQRTLAAQQAGNVADMASSIAGGVGQLANVADSAGWLGKLKK